MNGYERYEFMKAIGIDKLAAAVEGDIDSCSLDASTKVFRVCIDSRAAGQGDVFFAICGENFDGHEYVEQAFANGAVCAVCSRDVECGDNVIVKVDGDGQMDLDYLPKLIAPILAGEADYTKGNRFIYGSAETPGKRT